MKLLSNVYGSRTGFSFVSLLCAAVDDSFTDGRIVVLKTHWRNSEIAFSPVDGCHVSARRREEVNFKHKKLHVTNHQLCSAGIEAPQLSISSLEIYNFLVCLEQDYNKNDV